MSRQLENDGDRLSRNIRQQIGCAMNTRFCHSLAAFQPSEGLPSALGELLARLDVPEERRQLRHG